MIVGLSVAYRRQAPTTSAQYLIQTCSGIETAEDNIPYRVTRSVEGLYGLGCKEFYTDLTPKKVRQNVTSI